MLSQGQNALTQTLIPQTFDKATGGGAGGFNVFADFSVNSAVVDGGYADKSLVLRTGGSVNPAGAFTGGSTGNKAILGRFGYNKLPLNSFISLSYTWKLVTGPGGPYYIPPGAGTVCTPYWNLLVDFNPAGPIHNVRVLVMCDDSLAPIITNAIGSFVNDGNNVLTYGWNKSQYVLIVNSPTLLPAPGGVLPAISVGLNWQANAYDFAALLAANPTAVVVDEWPNDGGMPAGAILPGPLLISGDSGNITKAGYNVTSLKINNQELLV